MSRDSADSPTFTINTGQGRRSRAAFGPATPSLCERTATQPESPGRLLPFDRPTLRYRGHRLVLAAAPLDGTRRYVCGGRADSEARRRLRSARLRLATLDWPMGYRRGIRCMRSLGYFARARAQAQQWPARAGQKRSPRPMAASNRFGHVREAVLPPTDSDNAGCLIGSLPSRGSVVDLLTAGRTEAEIGMPALRATVSLSLVSVSTRWFWSSRVRLGVV